MESSVRLDPNLLRLKDIFCKFNLRNTETNPNLLFLSSPSQPFLSSCASESTPWRLKKKWDGSWSRLRSLTTLRPPSSLLLPTKSSPSARDPRSLTLQSPAYTPPSSPTNIMIPSFSTRHSFHLSLSLVFRIFLINKDSIFRFGCS